MPTDGNAIVYCEGAFGTTNGKTAHGLVRRTTRYRVLSVIDSRAAGTDAAGFLDGRPAGIPIVGDLQAALTDAERRGLRATHFVVGLAPDGGRLSASARQDVLAAVRAGLNVDCGLHDFLEDDEEIANAAANRGLQIRDVRKPPPKSGLHAFTGKIEQVESLVVALLGTDSAIGKRTTAWVLVDSLNAAGHKAELVGTGQTAWMQGARYSLILDSLISDFMAGETEHAVWSAWNAERPEVIVIEGQGSLMNPAYPGGMELIAAGRPDAIVLQHAPTRQEYDGFPGYPLHPLDLQIQALELLSQKPVVAITINHEGLVREQIPKVCAEIERQVGRPTVDVLVQGADRLIEAIRCRGVDKSKVRRR